MKKKMNGLFLLAALLLLFCGGCTEALEPIDVFSGEDISETGDITTTAPSLTAVKANNNSTVHLAGDITTGGYEAHGVYAANGSTVNISGDIETTNTLAKGIFAESGTAAITGDITTTGQLADGAYAKNGGTITVVGDIKTSGSGAGGVSAGTSTTDDGSVSTIVMTGNIETAETEAHGASAYFGSSAAVTGNITTTGGGYGVNAGFGGTVTVTGNIDAAGQNVIGAYSHAGNGEPGSNVTVNGNISAVGGHAIGVGAQQGSAVTVTGNTEAKGIYAKGVYATGEGSTALVGGNVAVEGQGSYGIDASSGSTVTVTGNVGAAGQDAYGVSAVDYSTVTVTGDITTTLEAGTYMGVGVFSTMGSTVFVTGDFKMTGENAKGLCADQNSSINISGDVEVTGTQVLGVFADNGSTIQVDGSIETSGEKSHAILAKNNAIVNMNGETVKATDPSAWHMLIADNGIINLTGVTINNGNQNLASIMDHGLYTGWLYGGYEGNGTINATNSLLAGNVVHSGELVGTLALNLTNSNLNGMVNAAGDGVIDLALNGSNWNVTGNSATLGALNIGSGSTVNYSPAALGTTVTLDSLSGNGNFLMKTDIVNQTADQLVVTGTSTGSHNISVQNQGSAVVTGEEKVRLVSTADKGSTFALTNKVELGAWQYLLENEEDGAGQYWQLYGIKGEGPVETGSSNIGSAAVSTFIGDYLLGYAETNTLIQRLGDLRETPHMDGYWFRLYGGGFDSDVRNYAKAFDMDYGGVQAGYDHKLENSWFGNGDTYMGAFIGYSKGDIDYDYGGCGKVDHRTMGLYTTYVAESGFYFDAIAKYVWSKSEFEAVDTAGLCVDGGSLNGGGAGVSLEAGKRIRFGKTERDGHWYVEPQIQLAWQHYGGGDYTASNGLRIGIDGYNSLLGRAGVLFGYEKTNMNFYAKVSYVKEFDGDMDITANGQHISESMGDDWLVYGIGLTYRMNARNWLYFDFERASEGPFTQDWAVKAGWRILF